MVDSAMLDGKSILITGGTGSFGKRYVKTLLERYRPKRLVVFSRDELKQSEMRTKFGEAAVNEFRDTITDLVTSGVLAAKGEIIRLTARGRLLSNEVFAAFV